MIEKSKFILTDTRKEDEQLLNEAMNEMYKCPFRSLKKFDEILSRNPFDRNAWINKSEMLFQIGNIDQAHAIIDKILEIEPENITALWKKSRIFERIGNYTTALKWSAKLLRVIKTPENEIQMQIKQLKNSWGLSD